jgi:hypothetical protein
MQFQDSDRVHVENWMLTAMVGHTLFEAAKNTIMEGGGLATLHVGFSLVGPQTGPKEALISHKGRDDAGIHQILPRVGGFLRVLRNCASPICKTNKQVLGM